MEVLFGITGKDYVIMASDALSARSIVVMKNNEDKSRELNKHTLMVYSGDAGDTVQFSEYIQRNVQFYTIKNDIELTPSASARYVRRELAESLRSRVSNHLSKLISFV
jgi:20S proteasome subunit beta 4